MSNQQSRRQLLFFRLFFQDFGPFDFQSSAQQYLTLEKQFGAFDPFIYFIALTLRLQ